MGHTNQTANYNLPQFVGTDKPSWLGDINDAFATIDTAIAAAASEASTADGKADALGTTVSGHTTQIGTLQNTVTTQGNTLNTVTSLIGNGTPTTTDQTIIGAINELHADQGDLDDLTTTDKSSLVAAINEAAQGGGGGSTPAVVDALTPTSGTTLTSNYVVKKDDVVYFQGTLVLTAEGPISTTIVGTLPSGFRPSTAVTTGLLVSVTAGGVADLGRVIVGTDGSITAQTILSATAAQAIFEGYFKI